MVEPTGIDSKYTDADKEYTVIDRVVEEKKKALVYVGEEVTESVSQPAEAMIRRGEELEKKLTGKDVVEDLERVAGDPSVFKDRLARFIYTLNFMPREVYDKVWSDLNKYNIDVSVLFEYVRSPDIVRSDPYKASQVLSMALLLNEWERNGYLKSPPSVDLERIRSSPYDIGLAQIKKQGEMWEYINKELEEGRIPSYIGVEDPKIREALSKIDIISQISSVVKNTLGKGVENLALKLGLSDDKAKDAASAVSSFVSGLVSGTPLGVPGVNVFLIATTALNIIAQIAPLLDTKKEREMLIEALKNREFWEDMVRDVGMFTVGAYIGAGLGQKITQSIIKNIGKLNPQLADKISNKIKIAEGTPIYHEQKSKYYIDHETGSIYFRIHSTGEVVKVSSENVRGVVGLLEDPELGLKIANVVGMMPSKEVAEEFIKIIDDIAVRYGRGNVKSILDSLSKMNPEDLKGLSTIGKYKVSEGAEAFDLGGNVVLVSRGKPEAVVLSVRDVPKTEFSVYALAERSGIDINLIDDVLRRALGSKDNIDGLRVLERIKTSAGEVVFSTDGKNLKISFGKDVVQIPLDTIDLGRWERLVSSMRDLKSSLSPGEYASLMEMLLTQHRLLTPISPQASRVVSGEGVYQAEVKKIYDVLNERFNLSVPSSVKESVSSSLSATVGGRPVQISVNRQILGDDKVEILVKEIVAREYAGDLFDKIRYVLTGKIGFTEDRVGVIKLRSSLRYLGEGKGEVLNLKSIDDAIIRAGQSGDSSAFQELVLLRQAVQQIERGSVQPVVVGMSGDELGIVLAGSGAQAVSVSQQKMSEAVSRGDVAALQEVLVLAGVNKSIIDQLLVRIPQPIVSVVQREMVIPSVEVESLSNLVSERLEDTLVRIPRPTVMEEQREMVIRDVESDVEERYFIETAPGRLVTLTVTVPLTATAMILDVVDVVLGEGEEKIEAVSTHPPAVSSVPPAMPFMGARSGEAVTGGTLRTRGRGEKERLVI